MIMGEDRQTSKEVQPHHWNSVIQATGNIALAAPKNVSRILFSCVALKRKILKFEASSTSACIMHGTLVRGYVWHKTHTHTYVYIYIICTYIYIYTIIHYTHPLVCLDILNYQKTIQLLLCMVQLSSAAWIRLSHIKPLKSRLMSWHHSQKGVIGLTGIA